MLNKVILQGRLTADPELKHTPMEQIPVINFSLAVDENKKSDERKTNFFRCVAWRQCAEFICSFFGKGKQILIEGELSNNIYVAKDGKKQNDTIVVVHSVYFCGSKSAENCEKDFINFSQMDNNIPFAEEE